MKLSLAFSIAVLFLYGISFSDNGSLDRLGYPFYDLLQRSIHVEHNNEVILIEVDQASINEMSRADNVNFPWPRQYYGALSSLAGHLKAKGLFFDIIFSEESSYGVDDDLAFSELIIESSVPVYMHHKSDHGDVKMPVPSLLKAATKLGSLHQNPSSDGIYREFKRQNSNDQNVLSIPFLISESLGVENNHREYIEFYKNPFKRISFYNLIREFRKMSDGESLSDFTNELKGKIWVVGYSAPGLYDFRPTPVSNTSTGMFIHASSLANRLEHGGKKSLSSRLEFILGILTFSFGVLCLIKIRRPTRAVIFVIIYPLLTTLLGSFLLWKNAIWFNPFPLLLFLLMVGIFYLIYKFQVEWKERIRIEKGLQTSMSKEMMEFVRGGDIGSSRYHDKKEATILFSDIVGFTSITESLSPHDLVDLLNEYYDHIVELVFENKGYVDKFIGDAVMAIWGVPVATENHAKLGIQTAIKYRSVVIAINRYIKEINPELPEIGARVGIHTGEVIAGNIGSSKRFNYTVIGDAVNLAARLEAIGKQYNCDLLISEDALKASGLIDDIHFLALDQIIVKGRTEPTFIYTHLHENELRFKELYLEAFKLYQTQRFADSLEVINRITDYPPSAVIINRLNIILEKGVPSNYKKGIWAYDSKSS